MAELLNFISVRYFYKNVENNLVMDYKKNYENVKINQPISSFKSFLQQSDSLDMLELLYCGQVLEEDKFLKDYNISSGSTLYALKKIMKESTNDVKDGENFKVENLETILAYLQPIKLQKNDWGLTSSIQKTLISTFPKLLEDSIACDILKNKQLIVKMLLDNKELAEKTLLSHPVLGQVLLFLNQSKTIQVVVSRTPNKNPTTSSFNIDEDQNEQEERENQPQSFMGMNNLQSNTAGVAGVRTGNNVLMNSNEMYIQNIASAFFRNLAPTRTGGEGNILNRQVENTSSTNIPNLNPTSGLPTTMGNELNFLNFRRPMNPSNASNSGTNQMTSTAAGGNIFQELFPSTNNPQRVGTSGLTMNNTPISVEFLQQAMMMAASSTAGSGSNLGSRDVNMGVPNNGQSVINNPNGLDVTTPQPLSEVVDAETLEANVAYIKEMGISDEEMIRTVLEETGGDLQTAIEILFQTDTE